MQKSNTLRYLLSHFNRAADSSLQVPVDFELATGTTSIASYYKFPHNRTAKDYDHWARAFCGWHNGDGKRHTSFLQKEFAKLVGLNPSLEVLQPEENPHHLRHTIFGAATLFNPDDINFYIEMQKRTGRKNAAWVACAVPEYNDLINNIECRTRTLIPWVPSPITLAAIYKQVKDLPDSGPLGRYFIDADKIDPATPEQIEAARALMDFPSLKL